MFLDQVFFIDLFLSKVFNLVILNLQELLLLLHKIIRLIALGLQFLENNINKRLSFD